MSGTHDGRALRAVASAPDRWCSIRALTLEALAGHRARKNPNHPASGMASAALLLAGFRSECLGLRHANERICRTGLSALTAATR